jgi:hypothetical protein
MDHWKSSHMEHTVRMRKESRQRGYETGSLTGLKEQAIRSKISECIQPVIDEFALA